MSAPTWRAMLTDSYGYVLTEEEIEAWAIDSEAFERESDLVPAELVIATGSAAPRQHSAADRERRPGTWTSSDVFLEVDVDTYVAEELLPVWERAKAVAAAMNSAGVR